MAGASATDRSKESIPGTALAKTGNACPRCGHAMCTLINQQKPGSQPRVQSRKNPRMWERAAMTDWRNCKVMPHLRRKAFHSISFAGRHGRRRQNRRLGRFEAIASGGATRSHHLSVQQGLASHHFTLRHERGFPAGLSTSIDCLFLQFSRGTALLACY
jgi:hypothetical protein